MIEAANKGKIYTEETKFLEIEPKKGWLSLENIYQDHITALYEGFSGTYLQQKENNKKLITFKDFMKLFWRYLERMQPDVPFTRTGFVMSRFCPLATTGLVIELADADHGDDEIKFDDYIEDPNFVFYARAAKKFGFRIDKNAPWRLIADLKSDEMQKYMANYPLPPHSPPDLGIKPIEPNPVIWFSGSVGGEVEFEGKSSTVGSNKKTGIIKSILPFRGNQANAKFEIVEKSNLDSDMLPSNKGDDPVAVINGQYKHWEQTLYVTKPHERALVTIRKRRHGGWDESTEKRGNFVPYPGTQGEKYWFLNQEPGRHGIRLSAHGSVVGSGQPGPTTYEYIWQQTDGPVPLYIFESAVIGSFPNEPEFIFYPDSDGTYEFSLVIALADGRISEAATAKIEVCEIPWQQAGPAQQRLTGLSKEGRGLAAIDEEGNTVWPWSPGQKNDKDLLRSHGFYMWLYSIDENNNPYTKVNPPGMWGWLTQAGRVPIDPEYALKSVDERKLHGFQAREKLILRHPSEKDFVNGFRGDDGCWFPYVLQNNIGWREEGSLVQDRTSSNYREWCELDPSFTQVVNAVSGALANQTLFDFQRYYEIEDELEKKINEAKADRENEINKAWEKAEPQKEQQYGQGSPALAAAAQEGSTPEEAGDLGGVTKYKWKRTRHPTRSYYESRGWSPGPEVQALIDAAETKYQKALAALSGLEAKRLAAHAKATATGSVPGTAPEVEGVKMTDLLGPYNTGLEASTWLFWRNWQDGKFNYLKERWMASGSVDGPFFREPGTLTKEVSAERQRSWNRSKELEDKFGPIHHMLEKTMIWRGNRSVLEGEGYREAFYNGQPVIFKGQRGWAVRVKNRMDRHFVNSIERYTQERTQKQSKRVGRGKREFVEVTIKPTWEITRWSGLGGGPLAALLGSAGLKGLPVEWKRLKAKPPLGAKSVYTGGEKQGDAHGIYGTNGCPPITGSVDVDGSKQTISKDGTPPITQPETLDKTIVDFRSPSIAVTQANNDEFQQKRADFLREVEVYPEKVDIWLEKSAAWDIYNNVTYPEWQQIGMTNFTNIFHRYYKKSFGEDIKILKSYAVDFFNSFVMQNPSVTKTRIDKCNYGTKNYVVNRNMITTKEMEEQYPEHFWIEFYAALRILEAGLALNKNEMKSFFKKTKNLLEHFPSSGKQRILEIIDRETKGVKKTS